MVQTSGISRAVVIAVFAAGLAACSGGSGSGGADAEGVREPPALTADPNRPPTIVGTPGVTALEDTFYEFVPTASDPDGDPIVFGIDGKPAWLDFDVGDGRLYGTPGAADVGTYPGIVIWVSDGKTESALPALDLDVAPAPEDANLAPVISGAPDGSVTVGEPYGFVPVATDDDGDTLVFSIQSRPDWAEFDPDSGRLSGTPAVSDVGTYGDVVISVSDGEAIAALDPFDIEVVPLPIVNSAPTISGQPATSVLAGAEYAFTPIASDANGDALSFSVVNLPAWAQFDPATGTLSGVPQAADVGVHAGIGIVVSDGAISAALESFQIEVVAPNTPPTIAGTPPASVAAGEVYGFVPTASDADGDVLSFRITGQPSWVTFDDLTGALSGTPTAEDVGVYGDVSITVTDGEAEATLGPFAIEVIAPNTPPTIGGTPPAKAVRDQAYSFVPDASDADGDMLSFSVINLPIWAQFEPGSGTLSGTPAAADVGLYGNITIVVTDGEDEASLGPFSIDVLPIGPRSAELSWLPPAENTDGSALTNLSGYVIYWGMTTGNYSNSVTLTNPGVTTYLVENLAPGRTYYFVVTATNDDGLESSYSNEASKNIPEGE